MRSDAAALEDADRCAELWRAVINQARKHARGEGLSTIAMTEGSKRWEVAQAREFLRAIGARP